MMMMIFYIDNNNCTIITITITIYYISLLTIDITINTD